MSDPIKPETPFGTYLSKLRNNDSAAIPESAKAFNAGIAAGYASSNVSAQPPTPSPLPTPKPPSARLSAPAVQKHAKQVFNPSPLLRTSQPTPLATPGGSGLPSALTTKSLGSINEFGIGAPDMNPVMVRAAGPPSARSGGASGAALGGGIIEPIISNPFNPSAPPTPGPPTLERGTPKVNSMPFLPPVDSQYSSTSRREGSVASVKKRLGAGENGVEIQTPVGEILSLGNSTKASRSSLMTETISEDSSNTQAMRSAQQRALFEPVSTTPPITPSQALAAEYNEAVRRLKEKIYQKGPFAITLHFQNLDADGSGFLELDEFKQAIRLFNINVSDHVIKRLLNTVDVDGSGAIDYREFTDALRMGKIRMDTAKNKRRTVNKMNLNMDPDLPFGNPKHIQPYGIMVDADINLQAYDKKVDEMFGELESTFKEFDTDASGEIDRTEFIAAMEHLNTTRDLKLSKEEIHTLFSNADADGSGTIEYSEFLSSFAGGGGKRFVPEFLKPKASRCSQMGHPWMWDANVVSAANVSKIGSRAFDWEGDIRYENVPGHLIGQRTRLFGPEAGRRRQKK